MTADSPVAQRSASAIALPLPDAWTLRDSLQLLSPDRRVHLVVSGEPVAAGVTLAQYADRYASLVAERLPAYALEAEEPTTLFSGRNAFIRTFSWAAADRPRVTQVQALCLVADRGYVATMTTPSTYFPTVRDAIIGMLGRITIAELGGRGLATVPVGVPAVELVELDGDDTDDDWSNVRGTWSTVKVPA